MMVEPEILPSDQVVDFLLGAVACLIDASPSQTLLFTLGDLRFDPSRRLLVEIRRDDTVAFTLVTPTSELQ